ncbi:hypothetical protein Fmac_001941 [Flemingia macrophylla]|uniref:Uncharacterized protein n=1 Tax=Flemingia macrophylla TaxID=520843 RepID=A0ABD1NJ42_9FABA
MGMTEGVRTGELSRRSWKIPRSVLAASILQSKAVRSILGPMGNRLTKILSRRLVILLPYLTRWITMACEVVHELDLMRTRMSYDLLQANLGKVSITYSLESKAVCLPSHSLGKFWPTFTVLPFPHSLSSLSRTFPAFPVSLFKNYCELGFGFDSSPVDDDRCLSDTLLVVGLYYAINKRYNNCLLSKTTSSSSDCDNTPSPFGSPHSSIFTIGK